LPESTAQKGTFLSGYPPASKALFQKGWIAQKGALMEAAGSPGRKLFQLISAAGSSTVRMRSFRFGVVAPRRLTHPFGINRMKKDSDPKESSYRAVAVAILIAALTAAIGYVVAFIDEHRKNELQLANTQIEKLYGPLYAYSLAAYRAQGVLHDTYRSGHTHYFDRYDQDIPTIEQVEIWRRWMRTVFMPLNDKMESAITDNVQLLEGEKVYPLFSDLIVHVESYKATVAKWKDTDNLSDPKERSFAANNALIEYPVGFDNCILERLSAVLARRDRIEKSLTGFFIDNGEQKFGEECS
jgi:hypothetical protein